MGDTIDQWLVRTSENLIAGPYPREQIGQMIRDGHLTLQDEVCPANGYWLFLHEREEIQKTLGFEVPRAPRGDDEDVTETQTLMPTATAESKREYADRLENVPHAGDGTAVITTESLRATVGVEAAPAEGPPRRAQLPKSPPPKPAALRDAEVTGEVESFPIWKGIVWLLLGVGLILGIAFFRSRS